MQTALPHSKVIQDDRKNQKRICVILFAVFLVAMLGTMFIPVHPYSYSKTIIERTRDENGKLKQQKVEKLYEGNATLTDIIWRSKTEEGGFVAKELEEQGIPAATNMLSIASAPALLILFTGLTVVFLLMRNDNPVSVLLGVFTCLFGGFEYFSNPLLCLLPQHQIVSIVYLVLAAAFIAYFFYTRKHLGLALHGRGTAYFVKLGKDIVRDKWLYLLLLPGLVYFLVFKYLPMWGIVISFENYVAISGVGGSEWVGLYHFEQFFKSDWMLYLSNTLILSFMSIVFTFPAPIILALMLNEIRHMHYKKLTQTLLYVPHFISIVIVVSITYVIFGSGGLIFNLTRALTGRTIDYLGDPGVFRWMIIGQTIWKETGWGTIIFLAALTNVDTQLYEAAMIDGANRGQRLWHITLPAIRSVVVLMLILRVGSVLNTGYEHLILMANSLNRASSQTLDVFVYENGIKGGQLSYSTAVGLMKSVVSVILVITANKISHMLGEEGLY